MRSLPLIVLLLCAGCADARPPVAESAPDAPPAPVVDVTVRDLDAQGRLGEHGVYQRATVERVDGKPVLRVLLINHTGETLIVQKNDLCVTSSRGEYFAHGGGKRSVSGPIDCLAIPFHDHGDGSFCGLTCTALADLNLPAGATGKLAWSTTVRGWQPGTSGRLRLRLSGTLILPAPTAP